MNATPAQARRYVLVSLLGLLALAAYKGKLLSGDVGFAKRIWGVWVLGIMLGVAADFAPQVAGPFALLILVSYATSGGDKAIQNILGKIGGTSSTVSPATPASAPATASSPGPSTK